MSEAVSTVALMREAKAWTQTDLARASGVSQAAISRIESGSFALDAARAEALGAALDCPVTLLMDSATTPVAPSTGIFHRRRASTLSVRATRRIDALTHLTRLSVERLLVGIDPHPSLPLPRASAQPSSDPIECASRLRLDWQLDDAPIANLTELVEAAGVFIIRRSLTTPGQDAVSTWPNGDDAVPIVIISDALPADRYRFTLAHELGHLVVPVPADADGELSANRFASELLAPAARIQPELHGLQTGDLRRLIQLKQDWGLSVAALIRRAFDLHEITERQYREFNVKLGQLGWRTNEPGTVATETPRTFDQLIRLHHDHLHATHAQIAERAGMTEAAFRRHYLGDVSPSAPKVPFPLGEAHE